MNTQVCWCHKFFAHIFLIGLFIVSLDIMAVSEQQRAASFKKAVELLSRSEVGVTIQERFRETTLTHYVEYILDPQGELTIDQVSSPTYDIQWKQTLKPLALGYRNDTLWVRFRTTNLMEVKSRLFLEFGYPHLDSIELYTIDDQGSRSYQFQGDGFPFPKCASTSQHYQQR